MQRDGAQEGVQNLGGGLVGLVEITIKFVRIDRRLWHGLGLGFGRGGGHGDGDAMRCDGDGVAHISLAWPCGVRGAGARSYVRMYERLLYVIMYVNTGPPPSTQQQRHRAAQDQCGGAGGGAGRQQAWETSNKQRQHGTKRVYSRFRIRIRIRSRLRRAAWQVDYRERERDREKRSE